MKSVVRKPNEDPLVRVFAHGALDALQHGRRGSTNTYRAIVDRNLSGIVFLTDVFLPDDRSQQLVYDRHLSVSEAVSQAAWCIGIKEPGRYSLYNDRGGGCVPLDPERSLSDVLLDEFCQTHDGHQKLLLKRHLSRVTNPEKNNPTCATTSFVHWRDQYLQTDHPVQSSIAGLLCILQIQTHHNQIEFQDEDDLMEFVAQHMADHIPEAVTV